MAANDAWQLQGMNGAVPVVTGETFTGLSRGFFATSASIVVFSMSTPTGGTATATITFVDDVYVPGPITVAEVSLGLAIFYPESTSYTVV